MTYFRVFLPTGPTVRTVVFLVYEGAQLLDVSGVASVFAEAAEFMPEPPYRVVMVSEDGGPVTTRGGVALMTLPLATLTETDVDTVLVPGGLLQALGRLIARPAVQDWYKATAARARRFGSTCTGAFALAAWGLLDGRRAATHWQAADELARRFPTIAVDPESLFVEDGPVWTSAGVSTGIDMALALLERDLGRDTAVTVARRLVLQMRRAGHQSQFSAVLEAQGGGYADLVAWLGDNLSADLTLDALAARAGQAPRTFHRRFTADVGATPAAFVERLRLDRARTLLEAGRTPKRVAMATGFGSLDRLGRAFRRAYALSPSAYRALHAG
ncbi:helix-turn-helix domain-containing protein [Reyranella sp. CPCC 100927]|nr:helix-turn-helix domain-containing protein [Reyranella sp. CPCC 100927]